MSEESLKLSVVIPAYNVEDVIGLCIDSVCNQEGYVNGRDYEVIVVNDGSTDRTQSIIEKHPVKSITFESNKGRIDARKAGAEMATSKDILFIDCRVRASSVLFKSYFEIGVSPCYSALMGEEEDLTRTVIDRLFLALRRIYYGKYFKPSAEVFEVTAENFDKVPKGTTCFFCEKQLFLDSIPKDSGPNTSDDTLLMSRIVNEFGRTIFRCKNLRIHYEQRQSFSSILPWFTHRGTLFADYYIKKGTSFFYLYLASILFLATEVFLLAAFPSIGLKLILFITVLYSLAVLFVARNLKDFIPFSVVILVLMSGFWVGVTKQMVLKLRKAF